jgi:hypothetical protein
MMARMHEMVEEICCPKAGHKKKYLSFLKSRYVICSNYNLSIFFFFLNGLVFRNGDRL